MPDQMSTRMRFKKWVHCDVPCKKEMHFLYICIFTRVHKLWFYSCVGVEKNVLERTLYDCKIDSWLANVPHGPYMIKISV